MSFLNGTDPGLRQTRTPTVDLFTAGVDFTAGSSTQVTLTNDPGSENNVIITFDGIVQHRDTYSISGAVVTFDAAVPTGVVDVEATYTTTQPAQTPADNSVTLAKLSDGTQGGLIYYGGSGAPTELAAGTSGQYLQTQGAGANPQWASVTASGWEFRQKQTASSSNDISFTGFTSGYDYLVSGYNIVPGTDIRTLYMQVGTGAGPSYASSAYVWNQMENRATTYSGGSSSSDSKIQIMGTRTAGSAATEIANFQAEILNPADSSSPAIVFTRTIGRNENGDPQTTSGGGYHEADEAVTAAKFYFNTGLIASGEFFLYRRANA